MNHCPCCSASLLQHVRRSGIYWFCIQCRAEMPNFSSFMRSQGHGFINRYRPQLQLVASSRAATHSHVV
jgi:hypothetical protein